MKMRFWQKTYLLTLALFLLCMNAGILSLTVYTHRKNVESAEAAASAEQYYIATAFERDLADLVAQNGDSASPSLLMQSYLIHYSKKGLYLAFYRDDSLLCGNFKEEIALTPDSLTHGELAGQRHILISATLAEGDYRIVYGKNVAELDREFSSLMLTFLLTALGVSAFLAVLLYFVLKKLSAPLESLRKTTEQIEAGDYTVTAKEQGNDEFTLLAKSFNTMIAKINEQMKTLELSAARKQMLVDNLAHELRTPLTSIRGYAEFLEKAAADEEQRLIATKYILAQSIRLQKISDLLLDSAYIRGNAPAMEEVALDAILADAADQLALRADRAGVKIVCRLEPTRTVGNEILLSMLFFNLTENAIKASAPGGRVELILQGGTATVADQGKGMTEEQLLHITEPFYRTDRSRSRAEGGVGLGLALCKQIAEAHKTALSFVSRPGEGTAVSLTFTSLQ